MAITWKQMRCTNDKLGETALFGIYGGAICNRYMATEFTANGETVWTKVNAVDEKIVEDGKVYWTTRYVVAEK